MAAFEKYAAVSHWRTKPAVPFIENGINEPIYLQDRVGSDAITESKLLVKQKKQKEFVETKPIQSRIASDFLLWPINTDSLLPWITGVSFLFTSAATALPVRNVAMAVYSISGATNFMAKGMAPKIPSHDQSGDVSELKLPRV